MTNVVRPPTDCGNGSYDLAGASGKAGVYYRTTIRRLHNVDVDETANDVNSVDDRLRCAHPITFSRHPGDAPRAFRYTITASNRAARWRLTQNSSTQRFPIEECLPVRCGTSLRWFQRPCAPSRAGGS